MNNAGRTVTNPILAFLYCAVIIWSGCSADNPVIDLRDPTTFPGSYKLVSFTDKTGEEIGEPGLTLEAGKPTTVTIESFSVTITITGSLQLTQTRYTISSTIKFSIPGILNETRNATDTGTYSIQDTLLTIVSDDEEEGTRTATIHAKGSQLTIDFEDVTYVFKKQEG